MGSVVAGVTNSVNITSTGLAAPASTQTLVNATLNAAASGSTVYTVTAGKTFYCTGLTMTNESVGAVNSTISSDGTVVARCILTANATVGSTQLFTGGILFKTAETKAITMANAAGGCTCVLWGFEQ